MTPRHLASLLSWIAAICVLASPAWAHPPLATVARLKVTPDGRATLTVVHDSLAYALNDTSAHVSDEQMIELLDGPEADLAAALLDGRERFASGCWVTADGVQLPLEMVESPTAEGVARWEAENPGRMLPCTMEFVARVQLPPGARAITLRFPEILAEVFLAVDRPGVEPVYLPLAPAEVSPAMDPHVPPVAASGESSPAAEPPAAAVREPATWWRYLRLGFDHIIPEGTDHALFVLGLFLLTPRWKLLVWQITAFTIAHTVTLTLAALDLVRIPAGIIEPAIAVTIAFVAVENLVTTKVHPWRPAVAFLFGLIHGLGVASSLREVGLPRGELITGLVSFSVGVELGHLTILGAAFAILGWWRHKPWFRKAVGIPLSVAIAGIAVVWLVQRI